MSEIVNIVRFAAKSGLVENLGQELGALVPATREEPGCIRYDLLRDDSANWIVFEAWRDEAAIQHHLDQPYIANFLAIMPSLIHGDPVVETYRAVNVSA